MTSFLLGRDETGAIREPEDYWDGNQQIKFERYFKNQLSPWTTEDLKLKCEDCKVLSEDVSDHYVKAESKSSVQAVAPITPNQ